MFKSARIKLTAWYLLIIMSISLLFSLVIYGGINRELERFAYIQQIRQERLERGLRNFPIHPNLPPFDLTLIKEARERLILTLLVINLGILVISGGAGYFLASRTLKPIEDMVDEQKQFIADASHELRTPLTSLKTEIEVALRDKKLELIDAKNLLRSNLEEVDKMQEFSNYLLALSRYQNTNLNLKFEKLNLSPIIDSAVKKLLPLSKEKNINIVKEVKNIEVEGNQVSLSELFTILIDNAIKYSHKNGKIMIRTKTEKNHAVIEVEDFGMGIKATDMPHIFNRFYRADTSRSKNSIDGYGLGLSIAKSITQLHNGKISVKSDHTKGSIFSISLPRENSKLNLRLDT